MVGDSRAVVAVKPTPVRVLPLTVSAVISWPPRPVTEGELVFQVTPSVEVQITTSWRPSPPYVPVAVNPPPVPATASTAAAPSGDGSRDSVQVAPPSADIATNGACWPPVVVDMPTATIRRPFTATFSSWARAALEGSFSVVSCQVRPLAEVHAAGAVPAEPTAVKPVLVAVTSSICRAPPVPLSPVPVARCHPVRLADHQAAATGPPGVCCRPTMTYPAGPAATAVVNRPVPVNAATPSAA